MAGSTDGDGAVAPGVERHYLTSSFRETLVEHRLLADLLTVAWLRGHVLEVSRAETDQFGYDVVLTLGEVTRHAQIRASRAGARTSRQAINVALSRKPSGCVVWVFLKESEGGIDVPHYLFFGGKPGQRLPDLGDTLGKNPRSKTARPNTRVVLKGQFKKLSTAEELFDQLFGPPGAPADDENGPDG